jgi:transcriptional regulator with XRE-family HTH domain
MDHNLSFSGLMKALMKEKKITQEALAKLSGLSQPAISDILTGKKRCGMDRVTRLANALQLENDCRREFFRTAQAPRWQGADGFKHGADYKLYRAVLAALDKAGIKGKTIKDVVLLEGKTAGAPDACIIDANGNVVDLFLTLKIR